MKGWYGSKQKHSLASRGIKTNNIPEWWNRPEKEVNAFVRTNITQGEATLDWLKRHDVEQDEDGYFIFYHGTPKVGGAKIELRSGSLLTTDPENASFFASSDRGLDPDKDIDVYLLRLTPYQIDFGHWASLREVVLIKEKWRANK